MNLHGIVSSAISAVNPPDWANVRISVGDTSLPDGIRVPNYRDAGGATVQVQALEYNELKQLDGINVQGIKRAIYLNGRWDGLVRPNRKGGDLITIAAGPNAGTWLTVLVLEYWPDWCKVAVALQLNVPPTAALAERVLASGWRRVTTNGAARAIV